MRLDVLYQFDDKYAPFAGISITSLLENNRGENIILYLAAIDLSADNIEKFRKLEQKYDVKIVWLETKKYMDIITTLNLGKWNGSYATWLKLFVLEQIPQDVELLMYLDCDTIVFTSLEGLFYEDGIENFSISACIDSVGRHHVRRLAIEHYYNAGVLVFNLKRMRKLYQISDMRVYLQNNIERYLLNDQDLINDYFSSDINCLPMKYNVQGFHFLHNTDAYLAVYNNGEYYSMEEINKSIIHPIIIHFFRILGNYPWEKGNIHPCKEVYELYKAMSPWKEIEDIKVKLPGIFMVNKILYLIFTDRWYLKIYRWVTERELFQFRSER